MKGQIDATLVRYKRQPAVDTRAALRDDRSGDCSGDGAGMVMMPLELKTMATIKKKQYKEAEHRAQMMLYTLMLQSR